MGGNAVAREGLNRLLDESLWTERLNTMEADWKAISKRYRMVLFDHGEEREGDEFTGRGAKPGFSREKVEAIIENRGQLSRAEILRCRLRYLPHFVRPSGSLRLAVSASLRLCDGAVFGTTDFVNSVFKANRNRYGPSRKSGARKMIGADWGELRVLRVLKRDVISPG